MVWINSRCCFSPTAKRSKAEQGGEMDMTDPKAHLPSKDEVEEIRRNVLKWTRDGGEMAVWVHDEITLLAHIDQLYKELEETQLFRRKLARILHLDPPSFDDRSSLRKALEPRLSIHTTTPKVSRPISVSRAHYPSDILDEPAQSRSVPIQAEKIGPTRLRSAMDFPIPM